MKQTYDLKKKYLNVQYCTLREYTIITCLVLCILIIISSLILIFKRSNDDDGLKNYKNVSEDIKRDNQYDTINEYYENRKIINFSKLGEALFMNSKFDMKEKTFKILIWKEGKFLERRHIKYFTQEIHDPFENCSVKNCIITYEDTDLKEADAVVFLLKKLYGVESLPNDPNLRQPQQRWIFLTDDSPWNVFTNKEINNWQSYSGIFNWSMNYKAESDVPVPYGRTILISNETTDDKNITAFIPHYESKQKNVLLAMMMNDCPDDRVRTIYAKRLEQYLKIDIYGECGEELKNSCSSNFRNDCKLLNKYFFYLAFENSNCEQYMTENLFWNAYSKGAIPIIMGPTVENCKILLPPNSFLHIDNFKGPEDLANYLIKLNNSRGEDILSFHKWRKRFTVLNEHGYHGTRSYHYCRICEALNYNNEETKIYYDLSSYLNPESACRNVVT